MASPDRLSIWFPGSHAIGRGSTDQGVFVTNTHGQAAGALDRTFHQGEIHPVQVVYGRNAPRPMVAAGRAGLRLADAMFGGV